MKYDVKTLAVGKIVLCQIVIFNRIVQFKKIKGRLNQL